eukprot:COSAG06_NODE_26622_length_610_cov_1.962818_1_plen_174_part_10
MVHSLLWSAPAPADAPAEAPAATASERVLNSSLPLISFAISSAVRPSKSQPPSCSSESSISATRCGCVSAVIPKPRNLSHLLEFVLSVSWQIQRFASWQTTRGMFCFVLLGRTPFLAAGGSITSREVVLPPPCRFNFQDKTVTTRQFSHKRSELFLSSLERYLTPVLIRLGNIC